MTARDHAATIALAVTVLLAVVLMAWHAFGGGL